MKNKRNTLFVSILLILALSACNLPGGGNDVPDLALTITAQVLMNNQQQQSGELPTATPEFTSTPGDTATPEFTATSSIPMVTVSVNTNCRLGPGIVYAIVGALTIGQQEQVVGKNSSVPNYWVINNPNGSGTCWLWGEYATVTGDTSGLQEYAVPPTPTPTATPTLAPPSAVKDLAVNKSCVPNPAPNFKMSGTLTWVDQSDNEDGFNVYVDGAAVPIVVAANTTTFPIPEKIYVTGVEYKLAVESFNSAGKGTLKEVSFTCP